MLVGHLQNQVFTLAASIEISKEDRVGRVVGLEAEAAALLAEVKVFVVEARSSTGVRECQRRSNIMTCGLICTSPASMMMCLLGFRCMLRRIQIEICIGLGSHFTPDPETLEMYAEAVDFFCSLDAHDFDGYWLNCK